MDKTSKSVNDLKDLILQTKHEIKEHAKKELTLNERGILSGASRIWAEELILMEKVLSIIEE